MGHKAELIANATNAEKEFRELLRFYKVEHRFQWRIRCNSEVFYADFVLGDNVIVELDGGYHFTEEQIMKDNYRQGLLEEKGYKVLRLKNEEVFVESVMKKVRDFCRGKCDSLFSFYDSFTNEDAFNPF